MIWGSGAKVPARRLTPSGAVSDAYMCGPPGLSAEAAYFEIDV